jgi:hypothetical protein
MGKRLKILKDIFQKLNDAIHGPLALHCWENKGIFSKEYEKFLNWEAIKRLLLGTTR